MGRVVPGCLLAISSAAAIGCTGANSEEGQMHVSLSPLFYSAVDEPSGLRVLQGSTVCFDAGLPDSRTTDGSKASRDASTWRSPGCRSSTPTA
ncbi:hypothetical protein [Nannocystis pusilla]|uniref:hypothetical protein n=1 Tax=Nannocystis pusilla TaxID=889268 RepID=UPI003B7A452C